MSIKIFTKVYSWSACIWSITILLNMLLKKLYTILWRQCIQSLWSLWSLNTRLGSLFAWYIIIDSTMQTWLSPNKKLFLNIKLGLGDKKGSHYQIHPDSSSDLIVEFCLLWYQCQNWNVTEQTMTTWPMFMWNTIRIV